MGIAAIGCIEPQINLVFFSEGELPHWVVPALSGVSRSPGSFPMDSFVQIAHSSPRGVTWSHTASGELREEFCYKKLPACSLGMMEHLLLAGKQQSQDFSCASR